MLGVLVEARLCATPVAAVQSSPSRDKPPVVQSAANVTEYHPRLVTSLHGPEI